MEQANKNDQKEVQHPQANPMRHFLKQRKNMLFGAGILALGIVIGVSVNFITPLLANSLKSKPQTQPVKVFSEAEIKKQTLAEFYNKISSAQDKQDWAALYNLVPKSVRDNVTREQFIAYQKAESEKEKVVSRTTTVNSMEVNNNKGIVDRTVVTCLKEDCRGDNRKEDNAKREYEYVNGSWQILDLQPSERALKAANYAYEDSSKNDQKDLIKMFGYGSERSTFTVRNWAIYLDKNLEELVRVETLVEQAKAEKSRPVYVQQPAPIIQQPAPVIQQNTYPKHCTSNTIGDYTYTNCY